MSKFNWSVRNTLIKDEAVKERLAALSDIVFLPKGITDNPVYACVRLNIGSKFFIVKTKSLAWLEMQLNKCLKAYNISGLSVDNIFYPIVRYIHKTGHYEIYVKVILQSENAYQVIKAEYLALKKVEGQQLCLNASFAPYEPKFNAKTDMFGWLTKNQFLNYKKLLVNEERKAAGIKRKYNKKLP